MTQTQQPATRWQEQRAAQGMNQREHQLEEMRQKMHQFVIHELGPLLTDQRVSETEVRRQVDEATPMVDARLPDGSRVNVVVHPLSIGGPFMTIRKFAKDPYTVDDLINFGSFTPQVAHFINQCVKGRLNIVVSGGTGTGKTTLLNGLSSFIPGDERIVTLEDA